MILEKLVAISGKSGLFSMVGNRSNGLIVEELDTQKRFFASSRMHQFTPLASISIYTEDEENTVELREVMLRMLVAMTNLPVEDANADSTKLRQYFSQIMPEHDRERVLISDIKKLIKWFQFLYAKGLITESNLQKPASTEVEEEA